MSFWLHVWKNSGIWAKYIGVWEQKSDTLGMQWVFSETQWYLWEIQWYLWQIQYYGGGIYSEILGKCSGILGK